ncbi:hypothetical protein L1S32_09845 [Methanogenium sp. S4BF]|uniref:hypothetical protein n=1 Tax=Methanogenium sp. S4BF TaxID=1789226 RepID=UPI00241724FC|nr:hypothetical protein [Methanogenium sp. S4BF]WFN34143.1 hypothetical protein L1S32_09845 [Methanogenium sp. S4BF]
MTDTGKEWTAADCNIPGVVAGICLIALPFLGFWWSVRFGNGAFALEVSPFELGMSGFGQEFFSPLMAAVNLAIIISIVFFGALLLVGSVLRCSREYRELSDRLVGMAAKKPLWLVLLFLISIVIGGFGIEYSLRESGIAISLPVIVGDAVGTITASGITVQIPVSLSLNTPFWYAVVFAIIAVYAGIYQKRRYSGSFEENGKAGADESTGSGQM